MSILGKSSRLKLITAPAVEPVLLAEAKTHLRVDTTADDTLIEGLIAAARETLESTLSRALINQTWELVMDAFPGGNRIRLPRPPLVSVTSIKYKDKNGVEYTATSKYIVDTDSEPGQIVLHDDETWPSDELYEVGAVRVRYVAGYGAAGANVPRPLRQALLLLVGDWYENREDTVIAQGYSANALPTGVEALVQTYRIWSF